MIDTYTTEELVFSAINHNLGKFGDEQNESYIEQTDQWRRDKLNETYMFNDRLEYMTVPDRGLYLLMSNGIEYTKNEFLAIRTHDGLYEDANKPYYISHAKESKLRTHLPILLHHADHMASRIEYEMWNRNEGSQEKEPAQTKRKPNIPTQMSSDQQKDLMDTFNQLFK